MSDDPYFGAPFIDVDEWREKPRRHRFVHGGFEDTHTRFSFYLPPPELYQGRFFQHLEGGAGGHESLLTPGGDVPSMGDLIGYWIFDLVFDELGGYVVESNQGHFPGEGTGFKDDLEMYRASAQSARYSKTVAAEMYGTEPHDGYIFGASGGGVRSSSALENVTDVWSGGVPYVGTMLHTRALWSSQALATEVLRRGKLEGVVDALEPGGSGNPFADLDSDQAAALANLFRTGFAPSMVSQLGRFSAWTFQLLFCKELNPTYMDDFWTKPGYLGRDNPESLRARLVDEKTTVTKIITPEVASEAGMSPLVLMMALGESGNVPDAFGAVVDHPDPDQLYIARVRILTGRAAGRTMYINNIVGDILLPFSETCPEMFEGVQPGDEVAIDNRDYLAFQYYHRYNVAGLLPQLSGTDGVIDELRHLAVNGAPIYPQAYRETMTSEGSPIVTRGNVKSKTIVVMSVEDICVPYGCGTAYDRAARQQLGDRVDDTYRMWWVKNATHAPPALIGPMISETEKDPGVWMSRLINYEPVVAQALRDVVAWAEDGIAPPPSTNYELNFDNSIVFPESAAERGGIQPVATLTGPDGTERIDTGAGKSVTLTASAAAPPRTGTIVRAQWDPEGTGAFGESAAEADGTSESIALTLTHTYTKPGTYFPSFRVGSHRHGVHGKFDPVWQVARARVVVH